MRGDKSTLKYTLESFNLWWETPKVDKKKITKLNIKLLKKLKKGRK